jgi:hypothetical protein
MCALQTEDAGHHQRFGIRLYDIFFFAMRALDQYFVFAVIINRVCAYRAACF